jgi:hypothetical protein
MVLGVIAVSGRITGIAMLVATVTRRIAAMAIAIASPRFHLPLPAVWSSPNGPFGLRAELKLHEIDQEAADAAVARQLAERMMTPDLKDLAGELWRIHRCFRIAQTPEGPELIEYRHGSPNGSWLVYTAFEVARLIKDSDHDRTFHPRLRL